MLNDRLGVKADFSAAINFKKSEEPVRLCYADNAYKKFLYKILVERNMIDLVPTSREYYNIILRIFLKHPIGIFDFWDKRVSEECPSKISYNVYGKYRKDTGFGREKLESEKRTEEQGYCVDANNLISKFEYHERNYLELAQEDICMYNDFFIANLYSTHSPNYSKRFIISYEDICGIETYPGSF